MFVHLMNNPREANTRFSGKHLVGPFRQFVPCAYAHISTLQLVEITVTFQCMQLHGAQQSQCGESKRTPRHDSVRDSNKR